MSSNSREETISDRAYRERVRRYRPSSLLPLVARAAARYQGQEEWLESPYRKYTPWALADAARVCLAYGREHNGANATEADLLRVLNAYSQFEDPVVQDHDARACLLRMASQQMTWQGLEPQALARTAAIFAQTPVLKPAKYLRSGWETEVFRCTLEEYVGSAQLVWATASKCAGYIDLALFDGPDGKRFAQHLGRDVFTRVLDTHFATSILPFRAANEQAGARTGGDEQLRRFTYNPLRGRPLITGLGIDYLCPIPQLAWSKATPWGVYFTLLDYFGPDFASDLGDLFEQYIGRQLSLLKNARVLPEITYGPRSARAKTVDWIVVLPELVLLVEVKSAIPTEPARLGTLEGADSILGKLGRAVQQIDVTAQLIADRHPGLADVPTDRPMLGLAVTLEPFHVANAFELVPSGRTPVMIADAAEVEVLVTLTDTPPGQLLLQRAADDVQRTWSLDTALLGHDCGLNEILERAWNSYPWAHADE